MDFEIDFHPVGDATKAGDAISVRYGQNGRYEVLVIDGGTEASGEELVEHIRAFYGADTVIAHVVCSHPDTDHASGLRKVLESFRVMNLWIHQPWNHASDILPYYADPRLTAQGLQRKLREAYPIIIELIDLAAGQGTVVREPFQGARIGPFTAMSPPLYAYIRLVPQFRKGPDPDVEKLKREGWYLEQRKEPGILATLLGKAAAYLDENWDVELLRAGAVTAAENETSTVLYADFGTGSALLTADAGINALGWACDYAQHSGIDIRKVGLVQVPHHGSRSNVTPAILDRLIGPKVANGAKSGGVAVVSCPKDDEKHPRRIVVNAFRRRGRPVYKTQGTMFQRYGGAMPNRPGWIAATPFDWFGKVEAYDD